MRRQREARTDEFDGFLKVGAHEDFREVIWWEGEELRAMLGERNIASSSSGFGWSSLD